MPQDISANNKRIAKNTLVLYFRTFITMIVGLYTGRVMLQALGVDDFGVKSLVGAIIGFSTLITGTMNLATSRYITYSLGQNDKKRISIVFSTSVNTQIFMAIVAIVILEICGLWFLNTVAQIPEGRMVAAHWVFQCSLVVLALSLVFSPFNALIISYEKMEVYAYTSIVDALLALGIAFAIIHYGGDKLILYSILSVCIAFGMRLFYVWYCKHTFRDVSYKMRIFDKGLFKELFVFGGWNLFNNSAWVLSTQGINMLINVFFGVTYNAARGLAETVNGAVQAFVNNFTTAFSPQLTKSVAANEKEYAVHLCNRGTKFSWLMMYIFIVPVCCEAEMLLKLWLGEVPEMAAVFLRFAVIESLAVTSGKNLFNLIQADGRVKLYTIHAALAVGLIFPFSWILYYLGAPVWISYVIFIIDFFALNLIRFYDLKKLMTFSIRQHLEEAIVPCLIVSVVSFIVPILLCYCMQPSVLRFLINVPISVLWTMMCCVLFGLSKNERNFVYNKVKQFLCRNKV